MARWTFFGRILPERVPLTWGTPLEGSAEFVGVAFDYRVVVHASQAIVDIHSKSDHDPDVFTLRNAAADCIRMITDLIGYKKGCYFEVEIVAAVCKDTRDWSVFGIEIPVLANRRKSGAVGDISHELLRAAVQTLGARIALAEFREAMHTPVGTGFHCYRAIEAMMQSIRTDPPPAKMSDDLAWKRLRDRLRVDRSAIDEVKKHADFPRHGKPSEMSDAERARVFELTDEILARFLTYLIGNKGGLTEQDFPILTG